MSLEEVVESLNKKVLLNTKIPEEQRMLQVEKLTPDKKKIFSREREQIVEKLKNREYKSNNELRKDLEKVGFSLSWVILTNANLSSLDFSNVNFSVADLSGCDFSGCNLSGTDFSIANLTNARFPLVNAESANFSMVDCSGTDFSGANVLASNFTSCIGVDANFSGANLSGCDFSSSNLKNANFNGANTVGINLQNCILEGTIFEGTEELQEEEKKKYETNKGIYRETEKIRDYLGKRGVYASKTEYQSKKQYK